LPVLPTSTSARPASWKASGSGQPRFRHHPECDGEVRRGDGTSEFGRRVDIAFAEILPDSPSIMRRAQVMRRGCVGESNLERDMATEGWMKLAKQ
jgi:hypothetical protein